jgi:hypothetical protein
MTGQAREALSSQRRTSSPNGGLKGDYLSTVAATADAIRD